MKDKGWVKTWRKVQDGFLWKAKSPFDVRSAWIDLTMLVNHDDRTIMLKSGEEVTVHAGQCWTSYSALAERWHWSRNRVVHYLRVLRKHEMCTFEGTPRGTLLTLVNYNYYQGSGTSKKAGRNTEEDAEGTAGGVLEGTSGGERTRMYKNVYKNDPRREPSGSGSSGWEFEK